MKATAEERECLSELFAEAELAELATATPDLPKCDVCGSTGVHLKLTRFGHGYSCPWCGHTRHDVLTLRKEN